MRKRKQTTNNREKDDSNLFERSKYVLSNEMDDMGANIMMKVRWFELWEQLRATDKRHQSLVETMYARERASQ